VTGVTPPGLNTPLALTVRDGIMVGPTRTGARMNRPLLLAALFTLSLPAAPLAQPYGRDGRDVHQDRRDTAGDRAEVSDDVRDLRRIEVLRDRWFAARNRRDDRALDRIEERVSAVIGGELRDARADLARDSGKAHRDAAEARDARRDAYAGDPSGRREAAEHAQAARRERDNAFRDRAVLDRLERLDREFSALRGRRDPRAMDGKARVLDQLVDLARAELRHDEQNRRMDEGKARRDEREQYRDRR
jgi:hypothetical protein